jgi:uncharacterized protein (DUF488 family)
MNATAAPVLWTIGHSTRPIADFLALLEAHRIQTLADVRRMPQSRRHPHFSREALERTLANHGIEYRHFESLGGHRKPVAAETNAGWRNAAFRGYADHMASDEFARGLEALMEIGRVRRTAIMCAEAVPWRCHRMLLSDALTARGWRVEHIIGDHHEPPPVRLHQLTKGARVSGERITYPGDQTNLGLGGRPD